MFTNNYKYFSHIFGNILSLKTLSVLSNEPSLCRNNFYIEMFVCFILTRAHPLLISDCLVLICCHHSSPLFRCLWAPWSMQQFWCWGKAPFIAVVWQSLIAVNIWKPLYVNVFFYIETCEYVNNIPSRTLYWLSSQDLNLEELLFSDKHWVLLDNVSVYYTKEQQSFWRKNMKIWAQKIDLYKHQNISKISGEFLEQEIEKNRNNF